MREHAEQGCHIRSARPHREGGGCGVTFAGGVVPVVADVEMFESVANVFRRDFLLAPGDVTEE